jgi:hypothetical protein
LVGGNGGSARSTGSDDVDESDEDDLDNESSLLIGNSIQFDRMSDYCTNCQ